MATSRQRPTRLVSDETSREWWDVMWVMRRHLSTDQYRGWVFKSRALRRCTWQSSPKLYPSSQGGTTTYSPAISWYLSFAPRKKTLSLRKSALSPRKGSICHQKALYVIELVISNIVKLSQLVAVLIYTVLLFSSTHRITFLVSDFHNTLTSTTHWLPQHIDLHNTLTSTTHCVRSAHQCACARTFPPWRAHTCWQESVRESMWRECAREHVGVPLQIRHARLHTSMPRHVYHYTSIYMVAVRTRHRHVNKYIYVYKCMYM